LNKQDLSERDICTKYITPAIKRAGWDIQSQVREEVTLTAGPPWDSPPPVRTSLDAPRPVEAV
jgi:hypothetical protein